MILTATEAARRISSGTLTAEAYARSCLEAVAAREPVVRAFAALDAEAALRAARELDAGPSRGPLNGVPFAVKDVIDTADLPTEMGSPIWQGYRPRVDAACVALSRAAGGVMLGKTVTAELAYVAPGPTTNPHDPAHTPGGSSSGSAAAVAAGMVPLALGTQTGGSVLRPASFCGVVGLKPSYGAIARPGMKLMADSLDTIGLMARTVEDANLFLAVLTAERPEPLPDIAPPRIGLCRTHLWDLAEPAAREAVENAARRLEAAGAVLRDVALPPDFAALTEARVTINDHEISRALAWEWEYRRAGLGGRVAATVERGRAIPRAAYAAAQEAAAAARARFPEAMAGCNALLTLGAAGEAPEGLASTGDSRFQGLWTLLHGPAVGLPTHCGPKGLPVGIQLVAPRHADRHLLAVTRWAMDRLGSPS
ncbi:amidase [Pararoseomonas indoligenes]|uniref:Amidase n=1 Tax=Roseomonas indoligenes TaxID=2820811 RepID=A0A940S853_9PROT|nr:amidase [Pararoseomonas indoligenes]